MREYFQYGKSYLIYGHDLFDNINIVNELIATIGDEYNEILYFDASPYGCYIEPKEKLVIKNMTYNIFGYFHQNNLTQETLKRYHELTALYIDKLFANGKGEYKQALIFLIKALFNIYKGKDFSIVEFKNILVEITEYSEFNPYADLTKTLDKINKIKIEGIDILENSKVNDLVFKARAKLEEYIYGKAKKTILDDFSIPIKMYDKQIIKYYTHIYKKIDKYKEYNTPLDSDMHKINYYNCENLQDPLVLLNLILETYVLKQKENSNNKKSLIILQSTQRKLEFELYDLWSLHQYADVCYVEFNGKYLLKELNASVPIKFYSAEHKNLGLKKRGVKKGSVKLEVSKYSIESS